MNKIIKILLTILIITSCNYTQNITYNDPNYLKSDEFINYEEIKSTKDTFKMAIKIYEIINPYIKNLTKEQSQKQQQQNQKSCKSSNDTIKKEVINKSFKSQENFINGKVPKSKTTKYIKELVDIAQKHKLKNKFSTFTNPEGVMLKQRVTIIPNITNNLSA